MQQPRLSTVIWRGRSIIAVAVVAGLVTAALATMLSSTVYRANALLDAAATPTASPTETDFDRQQAGLSLARSYAATITSSSFLSRIAPEVDGGRLTGEELGDRVSASQVEETSLVALSVTGETAEEARALTQAVAERFAAVLRSDSRAQSDLQASDLRVRIAALDTEIAREASSAGDVASLDALREARAALTERLADVIGSGGRSVTLVSPPDTPASPVAPRPVLNAIAGLLVGALVGVGLAWLWLTAGRGRPLGALLRSRRRARRQRQREAERHERRAPVGPARPAVRAEATPPADSPAPSPWAAPPAPAPRPAPAAPTTARRTEAPPPPRPASTPAARTRPPERPAEQSAEPVAAPSPATAPAAPAAWSALSEWSTDAPAAHPPTTREPPPTGFLTEEITTGVPAAPDLGTVPVGEAEAEGRDARTAFDALYARMRARVPGDAPVVVGILAGRDFAGREHVARGIAQSAARAGLNVLLADADARGRRLSTSLRQGRARGLGDLVLGASRPRARTIRLPGSSSFWFMPAGKRPPGAAPVWGDDDLRRTIAGLAAKRALLLLDAPPAAASEHGARAVAAVCDALVLVVPSADGDSIRPLIDLADGRGAPHVLGVVRASPGANGAVAIEAREEITSPPSRH